MLAHALIVVFSLYQRRPYGADVAGSLLSLVGQTGTQQAHIHSAYAPAPGLPPQGDAHGSKRLAQRVNMTCAAIARATRCFAVGGAIDDNSET